MIYVLGYAKWLPWLPSTKVLYLLVVLSNTSLAHLYVLLIGCASSSDSVVDVFGLNVLRQRPKRTLTKQQVDFLKRLLVGFLEQKPDSWDGDQNVP
jgi:hypothetical protein